MPLLALGAPGGHARPSSKGYSRAVLPEPLSSAPNVLGAVEHATIGVVLAVPEGSTWRVEFSNEKARALFCRSPRNLPADLPVATDAQASIASWLEGGGEQNLMLHAVTVCPGSSTEAVRIVGSQVSVRGRRSAVLFFYEDAVPRAERALAESEMRFRQLLDAAPDAVVLGTRARFDYANPALVRRLGYDTMEEVVAHPLRDHLHPEDRVIVHKLYETLIATRKPQYTPKLRCIRKDGSVGEFDLRSLTIEWFGDVAILGIARDLTERRRVQAQLIRADRLASMGTLAAGVAHEINNPLAYLMLNLQYLMRELPRFDGTPGRLAVLLERLSEAEHGARRVSTIVGDLRAFAHPEDMERGPVNVGKAVSAAVKVVSTQVRHRARLVESYAPTPLVEASATRLEQVFVNLLINAAQAVPEGNPDQNRISVTVSSEAGCVIVEVRDTGSGIPADILSRVFDPFFTTKPRGIGTGLGLPISRSIVTALGGEITVQSEPGVGTTFRVSLPAAIMEDERPASPSRPAAPVPESPRPLRANLLVVDDEPLVADMLRRTLSEIHDVTVATDAQTALGHVLSGKDFDLIFCDLLMPRMSGMDLYERLKEDRPGVHERIVFMTGGAFTERAAQFLATVPNPKLVKPFDLRALEELVIRAVHVRHG